MSDSQVGYRPLMDLPDGVYNYGPRQVQDRIHSFVYGAMVLASLGLGIYAGHSVNPHYAKLAVPDQMMVRAPVVRGWWLRAGFLFQRRAPARSKTFRFRSSLGEKFWGGRGGFGGDHAV